MVASRFSKEVSTAEQGNPVTQATANVPELKELKPQTEPESRLEESEKTCLRQMRRSDLSKSITKQIKPNDIIHFK